MTKNLVTYVYSNSCNYDIKEKFRKHEKTEKNLTRSSATQPIKKATESSRNVEICQKKTWSTMHMSQAEDDEMEEIFHKFNFP